jgi:hypothetical protein
MEEDKSPREKKLNSLLVALWCTRFDAVSTYWSTILMFKAASHHDLKYHGPEKVPVSYMNLLLLAVQAFTLIKVFCKVLKYGAEARSTQKRLCKELRQSHANERQILEAAPDVLAARDEAHHFSCCGPAGRGLWVSAIAVLCGFVSLGAALAIARPALFGK